MTTQKPTDDEKRAFLRAAGWVPKYQYVTGGRYEYWGKPESGCRDSLGTAYLMAVRELRRAEEKANA